MTTTARTATIMYQVKAIVNFLTEVILSIYHMSVSLSLSVCLSLCLCLSVSRWVSLCLPVCVLADAINKIQQKDRQSHTHTHTNNIHTHTRLELPCSRKLFRNVGNVWFMSVLSVAPARRPSSPPLLYLSLSVRSCKMCNWWCGKST